MKFYFDTNVLVDLIIKREPFDSDAKFLFRLANKNLIKIYVSSHAIATTHYLCKKYFDEVSIRKVLDDLLLIVSIVPVTEDIIKKSLRSKHKDFEDALQIFCAHKIENLEAIVTRNLKDFSSSEIRVFAPDQAIEYIKNNQ